MDLIGLRKHGVYYNPELTTLDTHRVILIELRIIEIIDFMEEW
jgi:hypothetical protein